MTNLAQRDRVGENVNLRLKGAELYYIGLYVSEYIMNLTNLEYLQQKPPCFNHFFGIYVQNGVIKVLLTNYMCMASSKLCKTVPLLEEENNESV